LPCLLKGNIDRENGEHLLWNRRRPEPQSRIGQENDPERSELQLADSKAGPDRLLLSREIEAAQQEVDTLYARWAELEEKAG